MGECYVADLCFHTALKNACRHEFTNTLHPLASQKDIFSDKHRNSHPFSNACASLIQLHLRKELYFGIVQKGVLVFIGPVISCLATTIHILHSANMPKGCPLTTAARRWLTGCESSASPTTVRGPMASGIPSEWTLTNWTTISHPFKLPASNSL